jgi:putative ABC transport system substrate-binding protein
MIASGAAGWRPISAAEPRRIGVLSAVPAASGFAQDTRERLADALRAQGYEEGRNLQVDWRFGDGRVERLPELAAALVDSRVEVIVAVLNQEIEAAMRVTRTIPIVMLYGSLPVEQGYVASLARPGGNVTGTTYTDTETAAKLLQLIQELHPAARRVAILANMNYPSMRAYRAHVERAAPALGVQVTVIDASHVDEVPAALVRVVATRPDVLFFAQDPVLASRMQEIVAAARERRWPSMGTTHQFPHAGGLISYAPEPGHLVQRVASQVARLLAGQRVAAMPVEQPSRSLLVVNQRTAREIGFTVPRSLLIRADEVIE